jgi:hypothetical protein
MKNESDCDLNIYKGGETVKMREAQLRGEQ